MSGISSVVQDCPAVKSTGRSTATRRRLFVFTLIAAVPLFLIGQRCRLIVKSTCILYSIGNHSQPMPVRAAVALFSRRVAVQELQVPGSAGPIRTRIFAPVGLHNAPTLILVHGMAPHGIDDGSITELSYRIAAMGLRVVTPDIASERLLLMRRDALANIGDVVLWASAERRETVSLLGISYSGGLVLATAAQPAYASHVRSVFCISGYNDLLRLGHYYIHNAEADPNGSIFDAPAMRDGPLLMAYQAMDVMVPPSDVEAMRRIAAESLQRRGDLAERDLKSLPAEQQKLFLDIAAGRTDLMRQRFEQLMQVKSVELEGISPHTQLGGIKAAIFLLHGENDIVIPDVEAQWNAHDAPSGVPVHLFISRWMQHVALNTKVPFWSKLALANYVATAMESIGMR